MTGLISRERGAWAVGAVAIGLLWITHPGGPWIQAGPMAVVCACWLLGGLAQMRRPSASGPLSISHGMVLAGLSIYLGSSAITDSLFAWPMWSGAMALGWALLAGAAALGLCRRPQLARWALPGVALLTMGGALVAFGLETRGLPLYNDDHPSFILRLSILAETLPRWIPYNPHWNGGGATTYEAASGSLGPAVLLWPLLKLFPATLVYTPGIAWLFLILVPFTAGLSIRAAGGGWDAAWVAVLLALCPGWMLFRWMLEFGAIGACLAMSFLLPVCALLLRLTSGWRFGFGHAVALVLCSLGYLAWPGSWPMAVALISAVLVTVSWWTRGITGRVAGCGALVLILIAPLMISLLTRTDVARFSAGGSLEAGATGWLGGFRLLGETFRETNPLLLWLGIAGGAWFLDTRQRVFVGTLMAGLVLLAGWGEQFGGGPALSRSGLALAFVAILPASLAIAQLRSHPLVFAALIALMAVSGLASVRFYGNQTEASYRILPGDVRELADWLREHTPAQSRILFGGMAIHAYGGGHVAALPLLSGREMLAADYYHFSPTLVEYFCPPREFRETDADVHRYLRLYHVSHVVAYDVPSVIRFYRKYPDLYQEVKTFEGPLPKTVFRVQAVPSGLFHEGAGTVEARVNGLRVQVADPDRDAVIAYHHVEGLTARAPAEIVPVERDGRTWIGIRPHGQSTIDIRYRGWL